MRKLKHAMRAKVIFLICRLRDTLAPNFIILRFILVVGVFFLTTNDTNLLQIFGRYL